MHAWPFPNRQTHTYSTLIHIYCSKQTAKNITNEILAVKGQGIAVFSNFVLTIAFFNRHFIVVALSHPVEYFWYFGIRWLTYNCLWSRDLTDDAPILEALLHCKATLDQRTRTKCSVLKIHKEQLTCWLVENEFWVQKYGYETDHLKDNLQLRVLDRESKPSSFIWLSWIHISFSQQLLVESISSVVWQIVSTLEEKLKAKGKEISFNKPS